MKPNLAEIVCIVDRSGSMNAIREDAIGGFNSFLDEQKEQPGEAQLTLVLFNHNYELIHEARDIQDVAYLDKGSYTPQGMTALLDAVGRTIDDVGQRLADTPEAERPSTVIVSILTDGRENSSSDYTKTRVREMVERQQEKYSWEFIYLGANVDAFAEAGALGIPEAKTANFAHTGAGVREAHHRISGFVSEARSGDAD
jgi:Mg-chelatase subunit ChlD